MNKWLATLLCGITAGIIDILPMIIQKLDMYAIVSAFIHWIVVAFVINYVQISLSGWLRGMLIAEAMAAPLIIIVMKTDVSAVVPMLVMSAVLGSLAGGVGEKYISSRP
jgi:hypothetical protein